MASIGGSQETWVPLSDANKIDAYAKTATASLTNLYDSLGLVGFDIDWENGMYVETGGYTNQANWPAEPSWLNAWTQIIAALKAVSAPCCSTLC